MSDIQQREIQQSPVFLQAKVKAATYLNDPDKLRGLARNATAIASRLGEDGPLRKLWDDLQAILRLVGQLCSGNYTRFPVRSLLLLVAGLLYFVWPLDFVPDAIPVFGWLDDVTALAFVIRSIRSDLDAFQQWEQAASVDRNSAEPTVCTDSPV